MTKPVAINVLALLLVIVVFALTATRDRVQSREPPPGNRLVTIPAAHLGTPSKDDPPLCFVYRHPAGPGASEPVGGLVFALWPDGIVLFAKNPSKPGQDLRVGRMDCDVRSFISQLRKDGIADLERTTFTVPSADEIKVMARFDDAIVRLDWDERIVRNYGANATPSEQYRSFVKAWFMARITIAAAPITILHDLREGDLIGGEYRGYVVDAPGRTEWLYLGAE